MEHYYQNIGENWFNYENIYKKMVEDSADGSHFVEVGCWKGRSASYMGVEILNSNKKIKFDCIDTWEGSEEHLNPNSFHFNKELLEDKDWLYNIFLKNVEPIKKIVNPIRQDSISASKKYTENQLDFVFIDAAHDYESVLNDISNWYPKVKDGSILSGHDYSHEPVRMAVNDFFKDKKIMVDGDCWLIIK